MQQEIHNQIDDEAGAGLTAHGDPQGDYRDAGSETDFRSYYVFVAVLNVFYHLLSGNYLTITALETRFARELAGRKDKRAFLLSEAGAIEKVDRLVFAPGRPRFLSAQGETCVNSWQPSALRPAPGDPTPALEHIAFLFDGDWVVIGFVLHYLACLAQRPEQKIRSAILIIAGQGTGKGMFGRLAAAAAGPEYAQHITPTDLSSNFNSYLERARLVLVEEGTRDSRREGTARIKGMITDDHVTINRKGVATYQMDNFAHLMMFSNDPDAVSIDPDDRRWLVCSSQATPRGTAYYTNLGAWIGGGGDAIFLNFLLQRDISSFNPNAAPPRTAGRTALVHESRPAKWAYLDALREAGDVPFHRDLVTAQDLCDCIAGARQGTLGLQEAGRYLRDIGAVQIGQKRVGHRKPRLWALRRPEHWAEAAEARVLAEYTRAPGSNQLGATGPTRRLGGMPRV